MNTWIPWMRRVGLLGCCLWGFGAVATFRTQSFGMTWRGLSADLLCALVYVAPLAILPLWGFSVKRSARAVAGVVLASVLSAELFAGAQEWHALSCHGDVPSASVIERRWPPFRSHDIGFAPGYGWYGAD